MNWKIGLDRYLTTPPDDGFDDWCEEGLGKGISEAFYNAHEDWFNESNGQCNKWLNRLFDQGKDPIEAARIIERAFSIFLNKTN